MQKKAVLLDIDGTLVDSNPAHARSWEQALASQGIHARYDEILLTIGMGGDHMLPELIGVSSKSVLGETLSRIRGEIFRSEFLPHLKAFDGSYELLEKLKSLGLKLIVATSASEKDGKLILEKFGFDKLVDIVTCSDDAAHSKPNADIVLAALKKGDVKAADAFMLGDTPYDIAAAVEAEVAIAAFASELWPKEKLKHATWHFNGPRDLLNNLNDGSFADQNVL